MTLIALDAVEDRDLRTRVCIVGAGAAGITLACELDGCGFAVTLLEAGGLKFDPALNDYYQGEANPPHPDPTQFRRSVFGGTTGLWGGRCVPFDPLDLEAREGVRDGSWPISFAELLQYYPRAMQYCDTGRFDFTIYSALAQPTPTISGFDGGGVIDMDQIERYSLPTDFGRRYRRKLRDSGNVTVLLGARCLRLIKAAGEDRIEAVEIADRAGGGRRLQADVVVLAMGGIEVPRMLLSSDLAGSGFGNSSDSVGRYYMCHFESAFGRLVPQGAQIAFHFERSVDGVYCRRQLRFTTAALREQRLLNMAFRLHFPIYSDASHGSSVLSTIYLAKSVLAGEYRAILQQDAKVEPSPTWQHVRNVLGGIPQLVRFAGDWLFRIQLAQRKLPYTLVPNADGSFPLEFNSEQAPRPSNRITLLPETDRHGLPRVGINWQLSSDEVDSMQRGFLLLCETLRNSGVCRLEFDEGKLRERIEQSQPLGGHHIGTARMAAAPSQGVVDAQCAVFGLPNLFVSSSAVFPTSSHANPTLTIVALAVRLGDHLRARLGTH